MKDEDDFLPADKHQRFLQIVTFILGLCRQACTNYPKQQVFDVYFLHANKYESSLQVDANIDKKKIKVA